MPVKESTLRFKIEGLQDVQGAVGQLKQAARDMRADEVAVQRTHRVVQEQLNAGRFPSEIARKNALAAEENQQRTISNITFSAENEKQQTAVRFLDQQYSQDIKMFKGATEQKAAYEATYEQKRRKLVQEITADETKATRKKEVERGQVMTKEVVAEKKAADERAKSAAQEKQTWNQRLIDADRYARKQEQDAIKLGKAESAAYDMEAKRNQEGEGGGIFAKALSGFGGKMILGHAAARLATHLAGSEEAGGMIGSTVTGALFGGPVVAAGVALMNVAGGAIDNFREKVVTATQAEQQYAKAINAVTDAWSATGIAQIEMDKFGEAMQKESKRGLDAAAQASDQMATLEAGMWSPFAGSGVRVNLIEKIFGGPREIQYHQAARAMSMAVKEVGDADAASDKEYALSVESRKKIFGAEQVIYQDQRMMLPGYVKQRALAWDQFHANEAKRREEFAADTRASAEGVHQAEAELAATQANTEDPQHVFHLAQAQEKLANAKIAAQRLPAQQEQTDIEARAADQAKLDAMKMQNEEHRIEQSYLDKVAHIKATMVGHEQELALQDAARQEQARKAALEGFDITQRITDEKSAQQKLDKFSVQDALARFDAEAATAKMIREENDLRSKGATPAQINAIETGDYEKRIKLAQIEQDVILHKITLANAEYQRSRLNDPRDQMQGEQAKVANAEDHARVIENVARRETSAAETDIEYRLKRHMISQRTADVERMILGDQRAQEAALRVKAGVGSDDDKRILAAIKDQADARQRVRDTELYNAGQFSTKYSAGYVNFAALNQSRTYGAMTGPGSFETGQAGQSFMPSTFSPRWPGEAPGSNAGIGKLDEICKILQKIADQGGLN